MVEYLTLNRLRDEARMSGATARAALEAAGVKPNAEGLYNADDARAAFALRRDARMSLGQRAAGRGAKTAAATSTPDSSPAATLAEARARSELARARKLELDNFKTEQSLLDRDAVVKAGQHFAVHLRSGLMSFGPAIAASLVGLPADRIAETITTELRTLLGRLGDVQDFVLDRELA